jgi:hypothetical protein
MDGGPVDIEASDASRAERGAGSASRRSRSMLGAGVRKGVKRGVRGGVCDPRVSSEVAPRDTPSLCGARVTVVDTLKHPTQE